MSNTALGYLEPKLCELLVNSYEGELDDSNNYAGKGELKMGDGSTYDGLFQDGLMHGEGTYSWSDGVAYTGEFFQGTISGSGKYTWPDGSTYTGQVKSGKRHGEGVFQCSAGQIYDGEWQDGHRHGKGVASYYEGKSTTVYSGEWYKDLRQGYGSMRYASGNQYEGYWYADKKCGKGVMIWGGDQSTYVGAWEDDLPNGSGEILWANLKISKLVTKQMSSVYRGTMKDGEKSGQGSFIYADGSQYTGQWAEDVKHGDGVVIHGNGGMEATKFNAGRMINESATPTASKTKTSPNKHSSPSSGGGHVSASGSKELKLNISDLIQALPRADPSQDDRDKLPPVFVDTRSLSGLEKDLERIMLRYQAILRKVYHSLTSSSKLESRKDSLEALFRASDPALSTIDHAITSSVVNHQAYLCLSLNRFKAYAREVGITGPQYSSKDLSNTFNQMLSYRFQAAGATYLKQYAKEGGDLSTAIPPLYTIVGDTIGPTDITEKGGDFEIPLSELDFVNLLVRASVESTLRVGVAEASAMDAKVGVEAVQAPMTLPEVLRLALDKVQRHWEAKGELEPEQVALVSPMTQNCLRKEKKAFFKALWDKVSTSGSTVAMSKVMQFFSALQKVGAVDAAAECLSLMDVARGIKRPEPNQQESPEPSRPPTAAIDAAEATEGGDGAVAGQGGEDSGAAAEGGEGEAGTAEEEVPAIAAAPAPVVPSLSPQEALTSLSTLEKGVDFEDFLELLCMVVMSPVWVYEDPAIKLKQEEDKAAAAAAAAAEGAEEGGAPSESAPVDGGPVDETKEGGEEGAPQEEAEVAPPKELPEVLVERLVVFSSCFDLALLP